MDWMLILVCVAAFLSGFLSVAVLFYGVPWLCSAIGRRRDQRRSEARLRELREAKRGETNGASSSEATETSGAKKSG